MRIASARRFERLINEDMCFGEEKYPSTHCDACSKVITPPESQTIGLHQVKKIIDNTCLLPAIDRACMYVCIYRGRPLWGCPWDRAFQLGQEEGAIGTVGPISQPQRVFSEPTLTWATNLMNREVVSHRARLTGQQDVKRP